MTLFPAPFDGVGGPSQTCESLVRGMAGAGLHSPIYVNRFRTDPAGLEVHAALPGPLARLPYRHVAAAASARIERRFLRDTRPDDICHAWPSVSIRTIRALKARGNTVILEAINTPMSSAKTILDAAYGALGAEPAHEISETRVAEEWEALKLADAIFCPSPETEKRLAGTPFAGRILSSSYGVDVTPDPGPPRPPRDPDGPVRCIFVGYACVRKGIHLLLDLWDRLPERYELRIVGRIEPLIQTRYARLLASDRIKTTGFSRDVPRHLAEADIFVFPSLEEGDPRITYEAADAGLPLAVSSVGGGRMVADTGCGLLLDPYSPPSILEAIRTLGEDAALRAEWGHKARAAVADYDWSRVGRRRVALLEDAFGS